MNTDANDPFAKIIETTANSTTAQARKLVVSHFATPSGQTGQTLDLKSFPTQLALATWLAKWRTQERLDMHKLEMDIYKKGEEKETGFLSLMVLKNCISRLEKKVLGPMREAEAVYLLQYSFSQSPNNTVYIEFDGEYSMNFVIYPTEPKQFNGRMKIQQIDEKYLVTPYGKPLIN
jgi:hypothetical protein